MAVRFMLLLAARGGIRHGWKQKDVQERTSREGRSYSATLQLAHEISPLKSIPGAPTVPSRAK